MYQTELSNIFVCVMSSSASSSTSPTHGDDAEYFRFYGNGRSDRATDTLDIAIALIKTVRTAAIVKGERTRTKRRWRCEHQPPPTRCIYDASTSQCAGAVLSVTYVTFEQKVSFQS